MGMSPDFHKICLFLNSEVQITYLHASNWAQKVHPDATRLVRRRGTCTPRKRPQLTKQNRPRPLGWFHFAGSIEVFFVRASGRMRMKTCSLFSRETFRPNR